jgi:tetratricopeptide (TPR) repeat protein
MQYQEYQQHMRLISDLSQTVRTKELEEAVFQLIMSDISDLDKADLCVKMADAADRIGKTEDAIVWFDKGVSYERRYARSEVARKKAEYLAQLGRWNAAIEIYEALMGQGFLREEEREQIRKSIQVLLGKSVHGWQ